MNRISTHVLDIAQGKPAHGLQVRLERKETSGGWILLGSARTDRNGRCSQLLSKNEALRAGVYRLSYDTAGYHRANKISALHPVVEITFQVRKGESQFHIPLLLSPHGYTTYRGS